MTSSRSTSDSGLLWVTDADNTLWDTDAIYRHAQLGLLKGVESALGIRIEVPDRVHFVRTLDEELARRDHRGFRYPSGKLVEALAWRLQGQGLESSASRALTKSGALSASARDEILEHFQAELAERPSLRKGVRAGLLALQSAGARVVVVTEGDRDRIERTIGWHGMEGVVQTLIYAQKTVALFSRIRRTSITSKPWAIGDQLEKDVLPAKDAGYSVVLFPSSFRPSMPSRSSLPGDVPVAESYRDAVAIALGTL